MSTPNLPAKIIPTNIAWLKLSGKFPMDMRIPPLWIKIVLESNPLTSTMLVRGLVVCAFRFCWILQAQIPIDLPTYRFTDVYGRLGVPHPGGRSRGGCNQGASLELISLADVRSLAYIYIYIMCVYIYIYIYTLYLCLYTHIYIYIYDPEVSETVIRDTFCGRLSAAVLR